MKKNRVFLKYYNVYCSKDEKSNKIEDIKDIEIVLKGIQKGNNDTTKYIIRYTFKNKDVLEFGESLYFRKIAQKVEIIIILVSKVLCDIKRNCYKKRWFQFCY